MDQNQIRPGACDMGMNIQPLKLNHCANGRHRLFCFAVTQVRKTHNQYGTRNNDNRDKCNDATSGQCYPP